MLTILFLNDGTGNDIVGNYKWKVQSNEKTLARGNLKGHDKTLGWEGLIKHFVKSLDQKKNKKR